MRYFPITLLLLLATLTAPAQNVRSTLTGRITDQSGSAIPDAAVTVTNTETNQSRSIRTNASGEYVVPELMPGRYLLTAQHQGMQRSVVRDIVLETGQNVRVDVSLTVGAVSQSIEVEAAAPLVNADTAAVGGVVENRKIVELPLNGRNYLQLAVLQPNVIPASQNSSNATRGGLNVAGGSEVSNVFLEDGISNNSASAGANFTPILDTVREFKVLTGTYSAEYGRMSGAQIIVATRSGTNQIHGAAWEFLRNSVFDARNFFASTKPSFHRNQAGGVLGGPVRKDRTFLFLAYESQRYGQQEASLVPVPPVAFRSGDFSSLSTSLKDPRNGNTPFPGNRIPASAWSPAGSGLLNLYPLPNTAGAGNYNVTTTDALTSNQFMIRGDHRFSDHDSLYLVDQWQHSDETDPLKGVGIPGWGVIASTGTQHAVGSWTHIFSPSLLAEFRAGYSRQKVLNVQQDYQTPVLGPLGIQGLTNTYSIPYNDGAPSVALSGYNSIGGQTSNPQGRGENSYEYVPSATWIHGNHVMKMGVDYLHYVYNSFNVGTGRGAFKFDGRYTGNSAADLLLGMPYTATRNLGDPYTNVLDSALGAYFQDDWKITPRLTLNLGLRYDVYPPITERLNIIASFNTVTNSIIVAGGQEAYLGPNGQLLLRPYSGVGSTVYNGDNNNFGPRLGLAWRPFGDTRTVIRSGFGTFYNMQMPGNGISQLSRSSPFRTNQTAGPFSYPTLTDVANMFGSTSATPVPPGIQQNIRTPYVNQWTLNLQRDLARNLVLEVAYQGSEGHKLLYPWNINQAYPGPGAVAARRPYQGWSDITGGFVSSIGNSNFNSLALRLERRFDSGLSFLASFLWSKSIAMSTGTASTDDASPAAAQNARDLRAERSVADADIPHRLVLSSVYSLPFGSGKPFKPANKALNAAVSGWQLTGILTIQSGSPFTVLTGTDASNTSGNADRPNVIGDWSVANPAPTQWFNPCTLSATGARINCAASQSPAWQINAAGTFGDAGRNILRGWPVRNLDLGLYRDVRFRERVTLQIRAEVFNAPNRPQFLLPVASLANVAFGQFTAAQSASTFGAQRQMQFGAKLSF